MPSSLDFSLFPKTESGHAVGSQLSRPCASAAAAFANAANFHHHVSLVYRR